MELAQASAGLQIGASETRYLFIFKDAASMQQFIDKGWDSSAGVAASAGTGSKSDGGSVGSFTGGKFYQLTKTGLQVGAAAAGTKAWKDKDLN
jgi:lipid-binding SYLF domain-containing protein